MVAVLLVGGLAEAGAIKTGFQNLGLTMLGAAGLVSVLWDLESPGVVPAPLGWIYPPATAALALAYGVGLSNSFGWKTSLAILGLWTADLAKIGYLALRGMVAGLDQIAIGMLCFVLAILISLRKSGALSRRDARENRKPGCARSMEVS